MVQSLGGGGGNGGVNVSGSAGLSGGPTGGAGSASVGLGGSGGSGGGSAKVTSTIDAVVTTLGNESPGVVVQSLGGGGGNGGVNVSGALSATTAGSTGAASVGLGGSGGVAETVPRLTVRCSAPLRTRGASAMGITIQSLGGGGGNGWHERPPAR